MYSLGHQYSFSFCVVCKSWSTTTSHHSFPKDRSLRKKWLNILCLSTTDIKTNSRVCGDHFSKACFSLGAETRPHLLPGSLPNPLPKRNVIVSETSVVCKEECENGVDDVPSTSCDMPMQAENFYSPSESKIIVSETSISPKEECVNELDDESTSGSDIAIKDEPFDETTAIQCPSCQPVKVKPSKRRYYVGDIKAVEDFSTPTMAKRNYDIIKRTMEKQRIKIRSLEQANRRLQKKINSLEGMIDDIKTENFIS